MELKKSRKKLISISLVILGIFVMAMLLLQFLAKRQLTNFLAEKIPQKIHLTYSDLDVNIFMGRIQMKDISVKFFNRDTALIHTRVMMKGLVLEDISYWQYLVNNNISIGNILLQNPNFSYYPDRLESEKDSVTKGEGNFGKTVSIANIQLENGNIAVMQEGQDSIKAKAIIREFILKEIKIDSISLRNKIPLAYGGIALSAEEILVDMGPFETLNLKTLKLKNRDLKLTEFFLRPKYGKQEMSKRLKKERDHIFLEIPEIALDDFDFGFKDKRFYLSIRQGTIEHPKSEIFRDKLVADDFEKKRLYSQMLRELPINVDVSKLEIKGGHLGYEELVNTDTKAGRIFFKDIDAQIQNISNIYGSGTKTGIKANALFMGNAPMTLDWSFDVNSRNDFFMAAGTFKDFEANSIDSFLESNMRSKAEGRAEEVYFTIHGNAEESEGDMKMKYEDFKFVILKKNGSGINKIFTAIGNIFVKSNSTADENGYRYGKIKTERDPTKSFFNYLWLNMRDGLLSTLTGNGEKK